jgi:hypothetical protein
MKKSDWKPAVVGCWLLLSFSAPVHGQATTPAQAAPPKEMVVTTRATGTFEVKVNPLAAYDNSEGSLLGRMSIDKQFHGDLEGTSKGEMLTGMTSVKNSAGYVAMERVTGALNGRTGTFILQHIGTMTRGEQRLAVTVVPDSGTGELSGIAGTMKIIIEGGRHSYEFAYTLADSR